MRFSSAMVCARSTFFAVMGKNAPAFTVASLATIMHSRPLTRPSPVTTPRRARRHTPLYIPCAAHRPSSRNSVPSSSSSFSRSRTVSRPLACCASAAFAPPPSRIASSSARNAAINTYERLAVGLRPWRLADPASIPDRCPTSPVTRPRKRLRNYPSVSACRRPKRNSHLVTPQ